MFKLIMVTLYLHTLMYTANLKASKNYMKLIILATIVIIDDSTCETRYIRENDDFPLCGLIQFFNTRIAIWNISVIDEDSKK